MSKSVLAGNNFLVPNGTFLAELLAFAVILALMFRYVVPPLQKAMRERAELIRAQFQEARAARERAEEAEAEYERSMSEARAEAASIRESARAQGQQIIDEMRAAAQAEVDRLAQEGRQQLAAERESLAATLHAEMGTLAVDLAARIVGESLAEQARRAGTVQRFLAELDREPVDEATSVAAGDGNT